MKEIPILMSAPMVRAILADEKTQTRRIVKPQPLYTAGTRRRFIIPDDSPKKWLAWGGDFVDLCPHGVAGNRLWVRETWRLTGGGAHGVNVVYRAEDTDEKIHTFPKAYKELRLDSLGRKYIEPDDDKSDKFDRHGTNWRPSIFMPRWASRITPEITGVECQRLHEITEEDLLAEGVRIPAHDDRPLIRLSGKFLPSSYWPEKWPELRQRADYEFQLLRGEYAALWETLNGPGSWAANPFVWKVTFKRL